MRTPVRRRFNSICFLRRAIPSTQVRVRFGWVAVGCAAWLLLAGMLVMLAAGATAHAKLEMRIFPVLAGAGAHDVYPAPDGTVWFTAQSAGKLGRLDPRSGKSDLIAFGPGAAPHGVIVGPDGTAWVTEGGQNAIARVDPATRAVTLFPLPKVNWPSVASCMSPSSFSSASDHSLPASPSRRSLPNWLISVPPYVL